MPGVQRVSAPNIGVGNDHGLKEGGRPEFAVGPVEIDPAERRKLARDRLGLITPGRHGVAPRRPRVIYRVYS
jgi:hypothetical protein